MPGWDPVELEDPEWLDGGKARDDPEAGQERGFRIIKRKNRLRRVASDEIFQSRPSPRRLG